MKATPSSGFACTLDKCNGYLHFNLYHCANPGEEMSMYLLHIRGERDNDRQTGREGRQRDNLGTVGLADSLTLVLPVHANLSTDCGPHQARSVCVLKSEQCVYIAVRFASGITLAPQLALCAEKPFQWLLYIRTTSCLG